jgi:hypothetical protein
VLAKSDVGLVEAALNVGVAMAEHDTWDMKIIKTHFNE